MAEVTAVELKIFGRDGTSDNFGKVGSARAGLAVNTKVISTIQALTAWLNGLQDAVNTTKKAPYIEEINSILYVITWNLLHVLEKGIPEWETTRTYYTGDIVKKHATFELYGSLGDSNLGNALPSQVDDSNWKYLGLLGNIKGVATTTMQKAGTETAYAVTPAVQQAHPSAAKAFASFTSAGSLLQSYNVTSVTKIGTGVYKVNFTVPFADTDYAVCPGVTFHAGIGSVLVNIDFANSAAGYCQIHVRSDGGSDFDPDRIYASFFGNQ